MKTSSPVTHMPQDPPLRLQKLHLLLLLSEPVPSGHRTPAGTVLFLNQVLPMYLLATCHHIPVTRSTSEIVKCTPDARPESPPHSVWPAVRPREGSGSASVVQITRNESQVMSQAEKSGGRLPAATQA